MIQAGLILEGGGMRGAYTAGVLDCFLEEGIAFPSIYGVSAGACHACSFLSGQKGRALRTVTDYSRDKNYAGLYSLLKTGDFFGVQMIYRDIPQRLIPFDYDAFVANPAHFYVTVTNLVTGEPEYWDAADLRTDMIYVQASSSLPLLSRTVTIDGKPYLDGGIADSIPLARSILDGNRQNVVVLTRHKGYRKTSTSMKTLMRMKYRQYPAFVQRMCSRHIQYNNDLDLVEAEEASGNALVIRPQKPVEIGRLEKDPAKLKALHREGYEDAKACLDKLHSLAGHTV
ncbi:patatin family protein [Ruminococcaceae bacterium OttesenSCG-928-L11]|nr:patatin family protein [Ruminococcaceae bacterium OttesenSCG-928-L11]